MQIPTHFLTTALVGRWLRDRWKVRMAPLLWGSVLPDLPLILLTIGYFFYRRILGQSAPGEGIYGPAYDQLYFNHPLWIVGSSLLHAPLLILLMAAAGALARSRERRWGAPVCWFAAGTGLHCLGDLVTHHDDGPLVAFPFDWHTRFRSPISYWDPAHHAATVGRIELALDLAILGYFAVLWLRRRSAVS